MESPDMAVEQWQSRLQDINTIGTLVETAMSNYGVLYQLGANSILPGSQLR